MYRTCIYCRRDLRTNAVVENFPVGRQLAFDAAKGRLWVICTACHRWNLSPLETRWEAIEECERCYLETPTRYSTDNIGLAQVDEGLRLIRVGRPERPEFAAWRYSREFWRRRVKAGAGWVIRAAGIVAGIAMPLVGAVFVLLRDSSVAARLRDEEGQTLYLSEGDVLGLKLLPDASGSGWTLRVPYYQSKPGIPIWRRGTTTLTGPAAIHAAGRLLPKLNWSGGSDRHVQQALTLIQEAGSPEEVFARAAGLHGLLRSRWGFDDSIECVRQMPAHVRLALEMVAQEDSERRVLQGELELLEAAWREAEEIAAIADRLLVPWKVEQWISRHRQRSLHNE